MVPEESKEAYICKTCGKIAEEKHLCNPAKGQTTCRFCGQTVEVARHMCRKKLEQTQYFCSLCGRLSVNEQYLCNPEKIG